MDPAPCAASTLAARLDTGYSRNWLLRGSSAWLAGRCGEALEAWRRAVALNPNDPIAWLLYCLAAQGNVRPHPALAQEIAHYLNLQGDRARGKKSWEDALDRYLLAFSLFPDVGTAGRLECVYLHQEKKDQAIASWQELAQTLPETDPGHWWALGRAAELREGWEEAAQAYRQGASLADQPYDYFMRWAAAWERLRDWAQAEKAYRSAVAARPDLFYPYLSVGHMCRSQGDYEAALRWYCWAKRLAPHWIESEYAIAYLGRLRQDYLTAGQHFERALVMSPRHPSSAY